MNIVQAMTLCTLRFPSSFVRMSKKQFLLCILQGCIMALQLFTKAFSEGESIPAKYTCSGADVSPTLEWSGAPAGTKSFALITDDPDAPRGTWVHWVLYDIPETEMRLAEAIPQDEVLQN